MKIQKAIKTVLCCLLLSIQPALATVMSATTTNIAGNIWESRYTITNNTTSAIQWFTIYFKFDLYENFVYIPTAEVGAEWDVFAVEPFLSSDGFVDAFSFGEGIAVGQSLTNFVVRYNFLGQDLPGNQSFEVYNANDSVPTPVDSGEVDVKIVPEPAVILLFGVGLLALIGTRKYQRLLNTRRK